ncbi:MAG: WD40 repeat domain-containing protein [Candidatus Babeliales bacterium]
MSQRFLLFIFCFYLHAIFGMAPQSLYQHYNVPTAFQAQGDMRRLLAQHIVGPAGWWYSEGVLPHGCFVGAAIAHPDPTQDLLLTCAEDCIMRAWQFSTLKEIVSKKKGSSSVSVPGEMHKTALNHSIKADAIGKRISIVSWHNQLRYHIRDFAEDIRSILVHPCNNSVVVVTSNIRHALFGAREKDSVTVIDFDKEQDIAQLTTARPYFQRREILGMTFHPEGSLFALAQGTRLMLWNAAWKKIGTLAHTNELTAVAFAPHGKSLATTCFNGDITLFDVHDDSLPTLRHKRCSLVGKLYPEGLAEVNDIKFHPKGHLLAVASQLGFIQLRDLEGNRLLQLDQHSIVKEVAFAPDGARFVAVGGNKSIVLPGRESAAVVWKQYQNPTLLQVLLRRRLQEFLVGCRVLCIDPEVACTTKDDFVPWMAERFNLKEDELKATWESMPEKLQTSIVNTLLYRASNIAHDKK